MPATERARDILGRARDILGRARDILTRADFRPSRIAVGYGV
jgi:hypothetical protein